jgi:hypothetical protein
MFTRLSCALLVVFTLSAATGSWQDPKAEMIPVKYDRLKAEVLKQRGKVVVVDFWAGY